jgi:hypothetical protein
MFPTVCPSPPRDMEYIKAAQEQEVATTQVERLKDGSYRL